MRIILIIILTVFAIEAGAQNKTRILFVLDASNSMQERLEEERKIDLAKGLLEEIIDSVKTFKNVELGLRVYGHLSSPMDNDCKDSRLEVPFSKTNYTDLFRTLSNLRPKGNTPLTYSLTSAANDFPKDSLSKNYVVLITDGDESCEGNPCEAERALRKAGVVLKTFVIGLGIEKQEGVNFDCFDTFYDALTPKAFSAILKNIIRIVLSQSTFQLDLLNEQFIPNQTDVLYSLSSKRNRYDYYHSILQNGIKDTLVVDPNFKYDLTVHTSPPLKRDTISIQKNRHHIEAVMAPTGKIKVAFKNKNENISYQIYDKNNQIVLFNKMGQSRMLLSGNYNLVIGTLPIIRQKNISIQTNQTKEIFIPDNGKLIVQKAFPVTAVLLQTENGESRKVIDLQEEKTTQTLSIQPGKYTILYRLHINKQMLKTKEIAIEIKSGISTTVELN